jgi:hypothetical protein
MANGATGLTTPISKESYRHESPSSLREHKPKQRHGEALRSFNSDRSHVGSIVDGNTRSTATAPVAERRGYFQRVLDSRSTSKVWWVEGATMITMPVVASAILATNTHSRTATLPWPA